MRTFDDLSDAEVVMLTDTQVEYYCDLACAMAGVPLLPPFPGNAPEKPEDGRDTEVFTVSGTTFKRREDATKVMELLNSMERLRTDYAPGGNYNHRIIIESDYDEQVKLERHYSRRGWDERKAYIQKYEADQKSWEQRKKDYDEASDSRAKTTAGIHERIQELRDREWKRERAMVMLKRYMELAGGDESVARRFLRDADAEAAALLPAQVAS